jgi:uncharacterized protein (TIGR02246 family)
MTDAAVAPPRAQVTAIVQAMQDAWNAPDGAAFAAPFAADADFVNVYGMHARGREAIGHGHDFILRGPYAGSTVRYTLESVRLPRPDVAVAHVHAALSVPAGPMAGDHRARYSMVLTHDEERWQIASFHNTFIGAPGAPPR